ncbi:GSCOCG00000829001-RA-CDS [Cotesia congregata]|uniref:Similar to SF3B2: Splicing factor 3B subunit 2 (Homo sapiens) n=1 Tax=Cotesia congregata TaxID=51543 RepID=A0A8J2MTZ8_COTCN|nr:GSCOCG00000829001-RA-CDS [Cotesia congregata]CAG5095573.1 Similar to SF3B2: Splicing factor 3B subunit 2 (Homo sapiens) [Cotesia congregata]
MQLHEEVIDFAEHGENKNVELPESIERALELKNEFSEETPVDSKLTVTVDSGDSSVKLVTDDQDIDGNNNPSKKAHKKKIKRGKRKKHNQIKFTSEEKVNNLEKSEAKDAPEVEYVQDLPELSDLEPMYRQFASVFENFRFAKPEEVTEELQLPLVAPIDEPGKDSDDEDPKQTKQPDENEATLSNRKLKQRSRPSIAQLKRLVSKPDVVEMHDVTARDPFTLIQLKATRNTVPVPRHWCSKTKYLQRKRGIEKPPFELPDFLKRTGITELRATQQTIEADKTLKCKMREKARPKMGRIDIEYEKLYDAFFKWQTKPRMTIHGDLYYEGKEFETKHLDKKPGVLSEELRVALGMPSGHNLHKYPPPYLIQMQRYGPPPSYPNLKISGLNAPLPEGCAFGYHVGGWGKPPVDQAGRPLYGDVFGVYQEAEDQVEEADRKLWGEPESESDEEEDDEDDDKDNGNDNEDNEEADASGLETPIAESVSDFEPTTEDFAAPDDAIELRKKKIEKEMENRDFQSLYTVLSERKTEGLGASMMGSTHVYDMTGAGGQVPPSVLSARRGASGGENMKAKNGVELTLDPSELDLNQEAMASKYEQTMRIRNAGSRQEDMSDLLQEHLKRQKGQNKRKQPQTLDTKAVKKYKEFKF